MFRNCCWDKYTEKILKTKCRAVFFFAGGSDPILRMWIPLPETASLFLMKGDRIRRYRICEGMKRACTAVSWYRSELNDPKGDALYAKIFR